MKTIKTSHIKLLLLFIGIAVYNFCFWKEFAGLNVLLYSLTLLSFIIYLNPLVLLMRPGQVVIAGCLIASTCTLIFNSNASVLGVIASFLVLSGFAIYPDGKFLPAAFANGVINYFTGPLRELKQMTISNISLPARTKMLRWWKLAFFPFLVVFVFFLIFYSANFEFAHVVDKVLNKVCDWIWRFILDFSWLHFFFLLIGFSTLAGLIFHWPTHRIYRWELNRSEKADYNQNEKNVLKPFGLREYSDEAKAGLLMLLMVNALVLVVNIIDIKTQWLGFQYHEGMNLSQLVHEGTGLLIFSILLSIALLLYLFRGNINFLPESKKLRVLAYVWIFQNAILCISVGVRNYHYIHNFGLAYKRIGVVFFLVLTVFGLITLCFKISNKQSAFYLIRLNSWAVYTVMLLIGCCNWDLVIARYNLSHRIHVVLSAPEAESPDSSLSISRLEYVDHTDKYFLLALTDKSLQAFIEYPEIVNDTSPFGRTTVKDYFNIRVHNFLARKEKEDILSWNYAEYLTQQELLKKYPELKKTVTP